MEPKRTTLAFNESGKVEPVSCICLAHRDHYVCRIPPVCGATGEEAWLTGLVFNFPHEYAVLRPMYCLILGQTRGTESYLFEKWLAFVFIQLCTTLYSLCSCYECSIQVALPVDLTSGHLFGVVIHSYICALQLHCTCCAHKISYVLCTPNHLCILNTPNYLCIMHAKLHVHLVHIRLLVYHAGQNIH